MANTTTAPTFADIGVTFNDATTRLVGGVYAGNSADIVKDLQTVQTDLQQLIQQDTKHFSGAAGIEAQNIVNQINLEVQSVQAVGTNDFAPKEINDIHRDIIDLVQGNTTLQHLATQGGANGFAPLPPLATPPAPYQDNADQTTFLKQWITDSIDLGQEAANLVGQHGAAVDQLIQQVQTFANNADTFSTAQGGLYSARFDNELRLDGTTGTAAHALIDGLQTGNKAEVKAASDILATNAADVAGNQTPNGGGTFADVVAAATNSGNTHTAANGGMNTGTTGGTQTTGTGGTTTANADPNAVHGFHQHGGAGADGQPAFHHGGAADVAQTGLSHADLGHTHLGHLWG